MKKQLIAFKNDTSGLVSIDSIGIIVALAVGTSSLLSNASEWLNHSVDTTMETVVTAPNTVNAYSFSTDGQIAFQ